jgi:hypothetical protein
VKASSMPVYRPLPLRTVGQPWYKQATRWLWTRRAYEITEDFFFTLDDGTTLKIPKGFRTDFASSPRPTWLIGMDPTGILLVPSLFHDWGYRHDFYLDRDGRRIFAGLGKAFHDNLLRKICEQVNGMTAPGVMAYAALAIGGWIAWVNSKPFHNGMVNLAGPFVNV